MNELDQEKKFYSPDDKAETTLKDTSIDDGPCSTMKNQKFKSHNAPLKLRRIIVFVFWVLFIVVVSMGIRYKTRNQQVEVVKVPEEKKPEVVPEPKTPTVKKPEVPKPKLMPFPEFVSKLAVKDSISLSQSHKRLFCNIIANQPFSFGCKSYVVADVIDLAWAIAPLFSCRGGTSDENLYDLHRNFISYLNAYGIPSIQIEAIKLNSNHTYKVARPNMEPYEMQSYFHNCSYLRENLLNVAIRKLKLPWEYMMWIDAHQMFENPMWIFDSIVQAEKYKAVQLFSHSVRLDQKNETQKVKRGFIFASFADDFTTGPAPEFGNAYIIRREVYEEIGYILDDCIANDCDTHYCKAAAPAFHWNSEILFPRYVSYLSDWLTRTRDIFNGSRTYLDNAIIHFYHQVGAFPFYELNQILEWMQYNKTRDVKRDENFAFYIANNTIAEAMENVVLTSGHIEQIKINKATQKPKV